MVLLLLLLFVPFALVNLLFLEGVRPDVLSGPATAVAEVTRGCKAGRVHLHLQMHMHLPEQVSRDAMTQTQTQTRPLDKMVTMAPGAVFPPSTPSTDPVFGN